MDNTDKDEYIKKLEVENKALKHKLDEVYRCWNYDTKKYTELKELYKFSKPS